MAWLSLPFWLLMLSVLLLARGSNWLEHSLRRREERSRLRAGLIGELHTLRMIYRLNQAKDPEGTAWLPGRPYFALFRGCMGKTLLLTEAEVSALARAHASSEALDALIALQTRQLRRAPADSGSAIDLDLRRLYRAARLRARIAQEVLTAAAAAEAQPAWPLRAWARLRRLWSPAAEPPPPPSAEIVRLPPPPERVPAAGA